MKKYWALIFAAVLCVGCLGLAACGGSGSSNEGSSDQAATAPDEGAAGSAAPAADPTAKFIGDWKIAAVEYNGVTMAGDFSKYVGLDGGGTLAINADGTGTLNLGESRSGDFKWEASGDDAITATVNENSTPIEYRDGALFLVLEQDGQKGSAIFTPDGTYAAAKEITVKGATPITSEAELLGTWKLTGLSMAGISVYGDADTLRAAMGVEADPDVTFEKGGVAKMNTEDGTWTVDANGAILNTKFVTEDVACPVLMLGDDIVIDFSGAAGAELYMLMSKA